MFRIPSVPVFYYHHVLPSGGDFAVTPPTFRAQMRYLAENGFTTLCAEQFLDFLTKGITPSPQSVLITFDDGYLDNYVYAAPILQEFGLHAILFAVTGWIGEGNVRRELWGSNAVLLSHQAGKQARSTGQSDQVMLRWSELEEMEAAGVMEVHCHSHAHIRWDQEFSIQDEWLKALEADLSQSLTIFKQRLGRDSGHLSWPWGVYQPGYIEVAVKLGFKALYTTRRQVNVRSTSPLAIGRISMDEVSLEQFVRRLKRPRSTIFFEQFARSLSGFLHNMLIYKK